MNVSDIILEHTLKFSTNKGWFNEQPIYTLVTNQSLSGTHFMNLSRIRTSTEEGASGQLVLMFSTTAGLTSVTGSQAIYAKALTSGGETADSTEYKLTTVMAGNVSSNLFVEYSGVIYNDILRWTGASGIADMNYIVNGMRPDPETLPTVGISGQSLMLYYTYNREELGSGTGTIVDRSGNSLSSTIHGSGSGVGTSATITGFTYSPMDGGFRFEGTTWLESVTSTLFNLTAASSGMTLMTFGKFGITGNSCLASVNDSTTEFLGIKEEAGLLTINTASGSISAAVVEPGRWYHITVALHEGSTTAPESGLYVYINGQSASYTAITGYPDLATPKLVLGQDTDLVSSGLTGMVGLTRIWNRSLPAQEIMMNYLATIPSMNTLESIKIG